MSCNLQLQRNTKVFMSIIDLNGGAAVTAMTPANTWQVEVLAGYAVSQAAATQDITAFESGTTPDRSSTRFNTSIEPVDWNFQVYIRPTGVDDIDANSFGGVRSSNSKPLADWYLWQMLMSNANPATGTAEGSAWQDGGIFDTTERATTANVADHSPNFGSAQEHHLYFVMDNIVYQVESASVNQADVDGSIDQIATTTWTGFGTQLVELTGSPRDNAIAVFGGTLNNGFASSGNSNAAALNVTAAYHPWETWNVAGTLTSAEFIKNRLSTLELNHTPDGGANVQYVFPGTNFSWTMTNNITFLTPEQLNSLNAPIGNFTGARLISGSITAYLRHGTGESAQLLRNIVTDPRVSHSSAANANIFIGGTTAPYLGFYMPSVQFNFPTHNIEDIITITGEFQAQEPAASCGLGGEVIIFAKRV